VDYGTVQERRITRIKKGKGRNMTETKKVSVEMGLPKSILNQLGIVPGQHVQVKEPTDFNKTIEYVFVEDYEDFDL